MHAWKARHRAERSPTGLWRVGLLVLLATTGISAGLVSSPDRIWRDPGEVASLDLFYGAGGRAHALDPAGTFTFSAEDSNATSPKFDVIDSQGVLWKVKLGDEAQAETAATRFLWAAGYLTDELYYVADLTVTGLPALERGREFVTAGGVVHGARLERKHPGVEKLGDWDWFDNPFVGQRELNGLRVMMSLLNSWDLKTINNAIYAVDGERHYLVSDLGATFGKSGDALTRTKGVPDDYANSKFIAKVTPECIDFVLHSRPHFLGIVDVWNYRERLKMEQITRGIPRADVQWLARRLSQLSRAQIRDAFRAAGYDRDDLDTLTRTMQQRIAALEVL